VPDAAANQLSAGRIRAMYYYVPQLQTMEDRQGGADQQPVEAEKWVRVQTVLHINKDNFFQVFLTIFVCMLTT